MELTSTDKKILTLGLITLKQNLCKRHPEAEKEIEQVAEKVGVLRAYKTVNKMYGQFHKIIEGIKELEKEDEPKMSKEENKQVIDLIQKAMESQDKPDLN